MKNRIPYFIAFWVLSTFSNLFAQDNVGIGTTNPRPSAILDLVSTTQGLLVPRVDTAQISGLALADNGLVVFDTIRDELFVWNGINWISTTPTNAEIWQNDGSNNIYNTNSNSVLIGTTAINAGKVQIATELNENIVNGWKYNNANQGANFAGLKARGTEASPDPVLNGDILAGFVGAGYNSSAFRAGGRLRFLAAEDWSATVAGTDLIFELNDINSNSITERMRVTAEGWVGIGTVAPSTKLAVYENTSLATTAIIANEIDGLNLANTGTKALRLSINEDGTASKYGISNWVTGSGTGDKIAYYGNASGAGNGLNQGVFATASGSATANYGVQTDAVGNSGENYGTYNEVGGTQTASKYGTFNEVTGNGNIYGIRNNVTPSSTNSATNFGIYNQITPDGTGQVRGIYNLISSAGTGIRYGALHDIRIPSTNTSSIWGVRSEIDQDGSGVSYGVFTRVSGSGTNTSYGLFVNQGAGGSGDYGIYSTNEERNYLSNNLGIGNTNPLDKLYVQSSATAEGITINNNATDGDPTMTFAMSGVDIWSMGIDDGDGDAFKIGQGTIGTGTALNIETSGNIGMGTTAPSTNLEIQENLPTTIPQFEIQNINASGDAGIRLIAGNTWTMAVDNSDGDKLKFADATTVTSGAVMTIETSGDVGIGTTAPSERLDVDNGGSIEVDGEYTYETSKTRVMFVAPNAFQSNQPHIYQYATASYSQSGDANEDAGYGYFPTGSAGSAATAVAPIYLPNGAVVTELEIGWHDVYFSGNLTVSLMRKSTGSINPTSLGSASSSGFSTGQTSFASTTTPLSVTIANNSNAYYLKYSGFQNLASSTLGLKSIKITYTVSQAD